MMRKISLFLVAGLMAAVMGPMSFGADKPAVHAKVLPKRDAAQILAPYVQVQEALAADSIEGVAASAAAIEKGAPSPDIKKAAAALAGSKTVDEARGYFKTLSKPMTDWALKAKPAGYDVVYCDMAKARWIQKTGEVANPYYGKDMLTCGEVVK